MAVEIKNIEINIDDQVIAITIDQAKALYAELGKIIDHKPTKIVVNYPQPYIAPYYPPLFYYNDNEYPDDWTYCTSDLTAKIEL